MLWTSRLTWQVSVGNCRELLFKLGPKRLEQLLFTRFGHGMLSEHINCTNNFSDTVFIAFLCLELRERTGYISKINLEKERNDATAI